MELRNGMDINFTVNKINIYACCAKIPDPVVTSFGSMPSRRTVFICIEDHDGICGWGEVWSNFPIVTADYRAKLAAWVLPQYLLNAEIEHPGRFTTQLENRLNILCVQAGEIGPINSIIAAVNQALWDLRARRAGLPLRLLLNKNAADKIPAYASGLNPNDCIEVIDRTRDEGFRAFKLKIGFGKEVDERNLKAIRSKMTTGEKLFVDANQGFSLDLASDQIGMLVDYGVDWFEEPFIATATSSEWKKFKSTCPIPLAGGENLLSDRLLTEAFGWLDYIQPDIGKWGGVDGCFDIAKKAIAAGKVYCPHWLSGGIGLLHSAHVLSAAGGKGLLEVDSNPNPLRTVITEHLQDLEDSHLLLGTKPGIGIENPLENLTEYILNHQSFSS